jgi:hypothetical protein
MEYALLMRTIPSSPAAMAGADGGSMSAKTNRAAQPMLRVNMDPPSG